MGQGHRAALNDTYGTTKEDAVFGRAAGETKKKEKVIDVHLVLTVCLLFCCTIILNDSVMSLLRHCYRCVFSFIEADGFQNSLTHRDER